MQLRTLLLVSVLAACGSKAATPAAPTPPPREARHQQPITSTTPVTTGEKEAFWTTLLPKSGCTKIAWNGGEEAVECASEPGAPVFIFTPEGGVTCDIAPDQQAACEPAWAKLNGD